jgi:hypothetical protein
MATRAFSIGRIFIQYNFSWVGGGEERRRIDSLLGLSCSIPYVSIPMRFYDLFSRDFEFYKVSSSVGQENCVV